eukprot:scaffold873_cov393-Prasinococcus_capsulatus_cf.AAC.19
MGAGAADGPRTAGPESHPRPLLTSRPSVALPRSPQRGPISGPLGDFLGLLGGPFGGPQAGDIRAERGACRRLAGAEPPRLGGLGGGGRPTGRVGIDERDCESVGGSPLRIPA